MSRFNQSELSRKIDDTIVEHLLTGEPTADEVSQDVLARYDALILEYGHDLAISQIRNIVSGRMKKILATEKGNALQLRLSFKFGHLEPESAITFRDDSGAIRYIATARATAKHHRRYIALLQEQIRADRQRLVTAEMFFSWLEPVFRSHPGITTAEAISLIEPEGQAA